MEIITPSYDFTRQHKEKPNNIFHQYILYRSLIFCFIMLIIYMIKYIEKKLTRTLTNRVNEVLLHVERNTETNLIKIQKQIEDIQEIMNTEKKIDVLPVVIELLQKYDENILRTKFEIERKIITLEQMYSKKYDEVTELIAKLQYNTETMEFSTIDCVTNKQLASIQEEIRNILSVVPVSPHVWKEVCLYDFNTEKIIFHCGTKDNRVCIRLSIGEIANVLIYDITEGREITLKFLENFKKIKSVFFEFYPICVDEAVPSVYRNALHSLFHKITEIAPSITIYYNCKDINLHEQFTPSILREFIKTNKYSAFYLNIEKNVTKDWQTGNMSFILFPFGNRIKEHCQKNNILFESNIGL